MGVFEKLEALGVCLCAEVADLCYCGLVAGENVALDYVNSCDDDACGMGYVRLLAAAPTTGIGVVSETVNNCGATLGFQVEVGVFRCFPMESDGGPPQPEAMLESAKQQTADMLAIRRALACCDIGDFLLDAYQPYGPLGGVVGGFWQATLSED
jgi:hypothetical protein